MGIKVEIFRQREEVEINEKDLRQVRRSEKRNLGNEKSRS